MQHVMPVSGSEHDILSPPTESVIFEKFASNKNERQNRTDERLDELKDLNENSMISPNLISFQMGIQEEEQKQPHQSQ